MLRSNLNHALVSLIYSRTRQLFASDKETLVFLEEHGLLPARIEFLRQSGDFTEAALHHLLVNDPAKALEVLQNREPFPPGSESKLSRALLECLRQTVLFEVQTSNEYPRRPATDIHLSALQSLLLLLKQSACSLPHAENLEVRLTNIRRECTKSTNKVVV